VSKRRKRGKVYFIGAGPGDPRLLTIAGAHVLGEADCVIYAGSLVHPDILSLAKKGARLIDSASLNLSEITDTMIAAYRTGGTVARVHSGDPSLYGALAEQLAILRAHHVPYAIIPGVSSVLAAAAVLGIEYTVPEITQTLILTRRAGRTPVPERESLTALAAHRCSMAIFLSIDMLESVVEELRAGGYPRTTPVAVVYRASWHDQRSIRGTLATIVRKLRSASLSRHALIIVGEALRRRAQSTSRLYAPEFAHSYRQVRAGRTSALAVIALTRQGIATGKKICAELTDAVLYLPKTYADDHVTDCSFVYHDVQTAVREAFSCSQSLVLIMATGIAVRLIAPLLTTKWNDPAVITLDDYGRNVISLVSGHWGGGNELARKIAALLKGNPVITTESDVRGLPSLDLLIKELTGGMPPRQPAMIKKVQAALLEGKDIGFYPSELQCFMKSEPQPTIHFFDSLQEARTSSCAFVVVVSPFRELLKERSRFVHIVPRTVTVGIGCHRGITAQEVAAAVKKVFGKLRLHPDALAAVCTIDKRGEEPGLCEFCRAHGVRLQTFTAEQVRGVGPTRHLSPHALQVLGVPGVAEPCALLGAHYGTLIHEKETIGNMTIAVAQMSLRALCAKEEKNYD